MARIKLPPGRYSAAFRDIWSVVSRIPFGQVATYGQVARMAGLGRGARTAGWAMNALPAGMRINGRPVPWHRVINAGGRISPRGEQGGELAVERQGMRLRREGIEIAGNGTIDLEHYRWTGELKSDRVKRRKAPGTRKAM